MSYKPYQLLLIATGVMIAILLASWTSHATIQERLERELGNSLQGVLNTAHRAVESWADQEMAVARIWADNPVIRQASLELLKTPRGQPNLISSPAQQKLREQLLPIVMMKGYRGYFIVDRDHISLASSHDSNIGTPNLLRTESALLDSVWSGNTAISQPVPSDVPLSEGDEGVAQGQASMFAGAPIRNEHNEVVALFLFRIDPHRDFTSILQRGRIGESGETYAFNTQAEMISLSRFDAQLHSIGLAGDQHLDGHHPIALRDPQVDLTSGGIAQLPRTEQPLTFMARLALQKQNGMNLHGYRDYRGVMVLGAWLWDDRLQMGFATEINEAEAKETGRYVRYTIIVFTVMILLSLLTMLWLFERNRWQSARQANELQAIIDGAPVALMLTDRRGNIKMCNRSFIQQYGWTTDIAPTMASWWQAAYPDPEYREQFRQAWQPAIDAARRERHESAPQQSRLRCRNGTEKEVELRMVPVSAAHDLTALVDLTERNRAMRTIRFERDRAQQYLDTVDVVILALDPKGTITQINRAGSELLGYDEDELIGRDWFETCLPAEERQRIRAEVHTPAMEADAAHTRYVENEVLTRTGERRLIAWRNAQLTDDVGRVIGSLSAGSDITQVRRAEKERERLFAQLQRSQKAEAIGQLSAGVSHNFNNMFGAIIGFIGLASKRARAANDDTMTRYLDEALHNSYRARDLIKQIASFSRKTGADIRAHDIKQVLLTSLELMHNILPSCIEVQLTIPDELPPVWLDEEQFQQVLANLLGNASDALNGQGVIKVTAQRESGEGDCLSCQEHYSGEHVVLQVHDTGHGMAPEVLQRIFDPFFSTREVGQGTGMGLPVVHGIVHNLGGHIQVKSTPGRGTVVSLYLPVARNREE